MIMKTLEFFPAEFQKSLRHAIGCFFEDVDPDESFITFEDEERIAAIQGEELVESEQKRVLMQFVQRISELSETRRTYARKLLALAEKCNQSIGANERDGICYVTGKRVDAGKGRVVIYRATSRNERNIIDEDVFRDFCAVSSIIWLRRIIVSMCTEFMDAAKKKEEREFAEKEAIELTAEIVMNNDHDYGRFAGSSAAIIAKLFMDAATILDDMCR